MAQVAIDTPDGQRGVVSAQKLLATVPRANSSVTVGVPPNCETLVVVIGGSDFSTTIKCTGVITGFEYPGVAVQPTIPNVTTWPVYFDVSGVVDEQVTVDLGAAPLGVWYVYADSGVHSVVDLATASAIAAPTAAAPNRAMLVGGNYGGHMHPFLIDGAGTLYAVPTIPSLAAGDHPPTELRVASPILGVSGTVVAAPGPGLRIRVFAMQMGSQGQAFTGYLTDTISGQALCVGGQSNAGAITLPAQGYPLTADAGINFNAWGGTGNMLSVVYYTIEAV